VLPEHWARVFVGSWGERRLSAAGVHPLRPRSGAEDVNVVGLPVPEPYKIRVHCLGCGWGGRRFWPSGGGYPCPKCGGSVADARRYGNHRIVTAIEGRLIVGPHDQRAIKRFMGRFSVEGAGCWLWTRSVSTGGYGRFPLDGRTQSAHRVAYEMLVGPIPEGLQLDHLCRNPRCVHPDHLEPVTCRENLLRGETLQAHNAAKTHCLRGHEFAGENVYVSGGRRHCRACRRERRRAAA